MTGILDFPDGSTWAIPDGWTFDPHDRPGHCRSCDAPVLWLASTKTGKRSPFNRDGVSHFATCPQASKWRKQR